MNLQTQDSALAQTDSQTAAFQYTNEEEFWAYLAEKLPHEKNDEQKQVRIDQWNCMDFNGNGYLSLAEIDKGMRDCVVLPEIFDTKPVMMRAY